MGIAPVVPAQKIREVIMQPVLVEMMKKIDDEMRAKSQRGARLDFDDTNNARTQTTEKDFELPVPTKEQFADALKKASQKVTGDKTH